MKPIKLRIQDLIQKIDHLTEEVANNIANNLVDGIEALLNQRHSLISTLIPLHVEDEMSKQQIAEYLNRLRQRDREMMQQLMRDRDEVKDAILKMNKMKDYLQ